MSSATAQHTDHDHVAAWVGPAPVLVAEVDAALDRLHAGPRAGLLPVADSPEGRQLRRWATQVVVTRRLLEDAAAELCCGPGPADDAIVPDRQAALELGGIVANVLARSAPARLVFAEVTRSVEASASDVAAYYARNLDEFLDRGGRQRPFPEVADDIGRRLTSSLRRRCFVDWVDRRKSVLVRLEPGHEHPGDPRQPDATHRH
jgi:[acyl-carrier-protein] S-malonyltransferase